MRLPRFRIRTMMIVVAVAGVALGSGIAVIRGLKLRAHYKSESRHFAFLEDMYSRNVNDLNLQLKVTAATRQGYSDNAAQAASRKSSPSEQWGEMVRGLDDLLSVMRGDRDATVKRRNWASSMRTKYENAARYPWLPVPPDPPEPE